MAFNRTVTIDYDGVGVQNGLLALVPGPDVSNYPLRFAGTYSYLKTVANGGKVESATGLDIFFTSDSGGLTRLAFEKVAYSPTTGAVEFFVNLPTLYGSNGSAIDTVIYLWYGQNNVVDISNRTGTWNSDYAAVYHFGDGTTLDLTDSTANGNNGTGVNTPTAAAGLLRDNQSGFVGGSVQIVKASSQYVNCGSGSSIQITGSQGLVLQVVIQVSSATGATNARGIISTVNSAGTAGYVNNQHNSSNPTDAVAFDASGAGGSDFTFFSDNTASSGDIYFCISTYYPGDSNTLGFCEAFRIGTGITASGTCGANVNHLAASGLNLLLGNTQGSNGESFDGFIDEVRILNTAVHYAKNVSLNEFPRQIIEINNWMQNASFPFYLIGTETSVASVAGQCNNPPSGTTGTPYAGVTFTGTGGATPYTFAVTSGSLPPGLTLSSGGVVSGTPTTAGTYNFTVTITDNNFQTATFNCSIVINQGSFTELYLWQIQALPDRIFNWRSQYITHGIQGYQHVSRILATYSSTANVTLSFEVVDGTAPANITLPSTSGAVTRVLLTLTFNKFLMLRYIGSSTAEFQFLLQDWVVQVGAWGRSGAYTEYRLIGEG